MKLLYHPHIVKVYDVIETTECIYIVMEYAVGGELFDYIVAHKRVKEKEARAFFRMVLSAVDYCHKVNIENWGKKNNFLHYYYYIYNITIL